MRGERHKTVLVLGAGASKCFGYPVGLELRQQIIALWTKNRELARTYGLLDEDKGSRLGEFILDFSQSQMYSIDAFLARRPEYSEIGKLAIATILLSKEKRSDLVNGDDPDHWYRYLFNQMAHEDWRRIDFSRLAVVSFNYDRCLETYLAYALKSAYLINERRLLEKLRTLQVVHVYGSLGPTLPDAADYVDYGMGEPRENAIVASSSLKVIPEGRDSDPALREAQALLRAADSIAFLGFGFDEINLRRLDAERTCTLKHQIGGRPGRRVVATCLGMTTAEARKVAATSMQQALPHDPDKLPDGFYNMRCLNLLRHTLILDQP